MKILAIETSCDDTGIAILEVLGKKKSPDFNLLSNIVASQIEVHKKYGGVYPMMAKREHQKNLVPTFKKSLEEAGMLKIFNSQLNPTGSKQPISNELSMIKFSNLKKILDREQELYKKLVLFFKKYDLPRSKAGKPDVDLISVTNGPGLEPCLWVGVNFAKALSYFWDIPIVPVNHIESHILVNFLENKKIEFPAVALVVSGGHTQLVLVKKIGSYKILGETRDDAAGECFDKCAKILGLGYPGGPIISKLASRVVIARSEATKQSLPRPMINSKDYDFSFSGLKTAVLYAWQKLQKEKSEFLVSRQKTHQMQIAFAKEIQQAIIDVLIKKTIKAVKDYNAKTIILGGGVSANSELRKQFARHCEQQRSNLNLIFPNPELSTDNGLMTAITGYFHRNQKIATSDVAIFSADGNLRIK